MMMMMMMTTTIYVASADFHAGDCEFKGDLVVGIYEIKTPFITQRVITWYLTVKA